MTLCKKLILMALLVISMSVLSTGHSYAAVNGWQQGDGGAWYYYLDDVKQTNCWVDGMYCLDADGKMYVSTETPDGYLVDETGLRMGKVGEPLILPTYLELPLDVFESDEYQNSSIYKSSEKLILK